MNNNEEILEFFGPLEIGDTVDKDLTFDVYQDNEIKNMSFGDLRGKWVALVFYPADFTFVCPTELGELTQIYDEVKNLGGEIISVSTDTAWTHKAWHDKSPTIKEVKYPMAADPTHALSHMFGVHIQDEGVALRGTFLIDPEGKLKTIEIHDNSIGRNAKELLRKIKAAKYTSENAGQVCPASWDTGSDTLKPGVDMVGEI